MDEGSLKEPEFRYVVDEDGAALYASWEAVDTEAVRRAVRQLKKERGPETKVRVMLMPAPAAIVQGQCRPSDLIERLHEALFRGLTRIGLGENADWIANSGGGQGSDWRSSLSEVTRRVVRYLAGIDAVFGGDMFHADQETEYRANIAAELLFATQAVTVCMRGGYHGMDWVLATCVRDLERMLTHDPTIGSRP